MNRTNHQDDHSSTDLPQAWTWRFRNDVAPSNYRQLQHRGEENVQQRREHLFEKTLTPSDVGKLNRLVIPKPHAERHFPLDAEAGEKGLLLSFEDESGKGWVFRYSYWTSSQSYVLTKGWSRFVKEKKLDTGDIVVFERRRSDAERIYIGWKRRGDVSTAVVGNRRNEDYGLSTLNPFLFGTPPRPAYCSSTTRPHQISSSGSCHFANAAVQQDLGFRGGGEQHGHRIQERKVMPVETTTTNSKRLRLFGVNLECGFHQPETSDDLQVTTTQEIINPRELLQLLPCTGFSFPVDN